MTAYASGQSVEDLLGCDRAHGWIYGRPAFVRGTRSGYAEDLKISGGGAVAGWIRGAENCRARFVQCGGKVERIVITDLQDHTYIAQIYVHIAGKSIVLDSRPSDAIALALRFEAPIFVSDDLLQRSKVEVGSLEKPGQESWKEDPAEIKNWLDSVNPDDFLK